MQSYKIKILQEDENERLDLFLTELVINISRSKIQKLIKSGEILVNDKSQKSSYLLKCDDIVEVNIPEEKELIIEPQNIPLDIRYEDENMLVVNKPSNMLTHPTATEIQNTLVNALLYKYKDNLSDVNGKFRAGILHRLDRNTSGLLMVAKNNMAHKFLQEQIKEKTAIRKYVAVVSGNFDEDYGTINKNIGRHPKDMKKMAVVEDGKPSITHYKVLERFSGYTFLELRLETGRTHQIRVHMASIGHPVINDTLYGGKKLNINTNEQVLQSYDLTFQPLGADNKINIKIDLDNDLTKTLNYLRSKK